MTHSCRRPRRTFHLIPLRSSISRRITLAPSTVATLDLSPTSSPKPAPTIFMAPFTTTSAIRLWRQTCMTTMPTVFHVRCSIDTNSGERWEGRSGTGNFFSLLLWNRSSCAAAPPILSSYQRRNCWPSALRELRRSSRLIRCQRICPRRTCNHGRYARLVPLVIRRPERDS